MCRSVKKKKRKKTKKKKEKKSDFTVPIPPQAAASCSFPDAVYSMYSLIYIPQNLFFCWTISAVCRVKQITGLAFLATDRDHALVVVVVVVVR